MHILFLTENFPPERNAPAARVYERALYWLKWGHDVTVITSAPNSPDGKVFEGYRNRWFQTTMLDGMRVVRVKTYIAPNSGTVRRILDFMSFMVAGYLAGLFQSRPDLVVATSPQFFCAVAGWAVGASRRVPFVFELADLWPATIRGVGIMNSKLLRPIEALELFLYRRSAAVVSLTRSFKKDLIRRQIDDRKIAVVTNGADLWRYRPQRRDETLAKRWGLSDRFVIGYIGTHGLSHQLENVLIAASQLRDDQSSRFMFVGSGATRELLIADAQERRLENVVFIPTQDKETITQFWALCDVALIHLKDAAVFETVIPSKMFEAMAMALPLILVSRRGEASRILVEEDAGLWVPAGDPEGLAQAVRTMAREHGRREHYARNSGAAASKYTREEQARKMLMVLESVVQGRDSVPEEVS